MAVSFLLNRMVSYLLKRPHVGNRLILVANGALGKSDPAAAGPRWVAASELGSERVSNGREHMSQCGQRASFNISTVPVSFNAESHNVRQQRRRI
jgi:hypothetical protein